MSSINHRNLYISELSTRLEDADRAAGHLVWASREGENGQVWYAVNAFLNAAIAVANILWPSSLKQSAQSRAQDLREHLGASQDAPQGLRKVRNGFEHFDERLDEWSEISANHIIIDTMIAPLSKLQGVELTDVARYLDPETTDLGVFGAKTNLQQVLTELHELRTLLPAERR